MNLPEGITNHTHIDKLPPDVRAAVDELQQVLHGLFGEQLESVYVEGSAARGDYVQGSSGVDVAAIVGRPVSPDDDMRLRRAAGIIQKNHRLPKLGARPVLRQTLESQPRRQFMLSSDAALLWGVPFEPTAEFPGPGLDLAKLLSGDFEQAYLTSIRWVDRGSRTGASYSSWGRDLAGRGLRLALGVAMARGGGYTASLSRMPALIREHAPELAESADKLWRWRDEAPKSQHEFDELLAALEPVRGAAALERITFEGSKDGESEGQE